MDWQTETLQEIETALQLLREREGVALRLLGRYGRGEIGAYRIIDDKGHRHALKLSRGRRILRAAATTAYLRQVSYPAPRYLLLGAIADDKWYAILEELPGQPLEALTVELVEQLLALVEKQARKAFLPVDEQRVVDTLLTGADGYALHETMRTHSSATANLLDEVIAIGHRYTGLDFPAGDIVHYDFHPANMLVLDGQISGVVDWEGTRSGDRAFDIATLLFYVFENEAVERKLWRALLDLAGPERATVYLAHMMLRQVEWSARNHDAATVQHYLTHSANLLAELKRLT